MLMTIQKPDSGEITMFGMDLNGLSLSQRTQLRGQISVVLQPTQFYKTMKVIELLNLFHAYYNSKMDVEDVIKRFHLTPYRKVYFNKLSGGWKQIVSLAIAFLAQPKMLILDEPTTGLDPHMRQLFWNYITDYNERTGGTVILSTHNMDEVELYCNQVMLLDEGMTKVQSSTEKVMETGFGSINDFYLHHVKI